MGGSFWAPGPLSNGPAIEEMSFNWWANTRFMIITEPTVECLPKTNISVDQYLKTRPLFSLDGNETRPPTTGSVVTAALGLYCTC